MQTPRLFLKVWLSAYVPISKYENIKIPLLDQYYGLNQPFYNTEWILLKAHVNLYNSLDSSSITPNMDCFHSSDNFT